MQSRARMHHSCLLICLFLLPSFVDANSLRFFGNGVNDIDRAKIQIDNPSNSNPGPPADVGATDFTIEFWIKGALGDNRGSVRCGNTYGWIDGNTVFDRDRYNQSRSFGISLGNGRVAFGVNIGNSVATVCGSRNVLDGAWHHVAVQRVRTSGALRIFVDGVADGSANGPAGDLSYPDNGVPGNYCGGSCSFSDPYIVLGAEKHDAGVSSYPSLRGFLDELRLSTTLRYSGNFSRPAQPFAVDGSTAALYHFDAASGTTVTDAVGSSPGVLRVGGNPQGPLWSADSPFTDGSAGALSLQAATYTADEGVASVSITVERTGGSSGSASVTYQTSGGTATPGADYSGVSGTLNWANGDTAPKSFTIAILDDSVDEPDETVGIQLTGASGAALGSPSGATLTIADDETQVLYGDLRFATASYTVSEGGGSINLSVTRTNGADGAVSVSYATGTGNATPGSDYSARSGTLSWAAGVTGTRVINVPILEDTTYEGTETFSVTLTAPQGGAVLVNPATATVTITENDAVPVPGSLRFAQSAYTVGEGGGNVALTVNRVSGSDGAVSVNFFAANGTATAGSDFTAPSGTLNWAAGDASARTINVPILEDTLVEGTQSFTVSLNAPGGGATLGSPSSATVSITDNDSGTPPPGALQFATASYQVSESGGSILIGVRRVNGSGGAVSVSYATANGTASAGADYTATSGVLSWPNGDVGEKSFSVAVATDALAESNETVNLVLSAPGGGASLGSPATSVLTITDTPPTPGNVFTDAFGRANGAAIGNGWIETDAAAFSLNSGRAQKNASSGSGSDALVYRPVSENLADSELSIEMRLTSSAVGYPQLFSRLQTGSAMLVRYILYIDGGMGRAVLARQTSSALTTLATMSLSPLLNTTDLFRLRLRTTGANPVALVGYVERFASGAWQVIGQASANDSTGARISSSGSTGFGGYTESAYWFDNFARTDVVAGAAAGASTPPVALAVWPAYASTGESGPLVVVVGANFTPDSRVRWNGVERATVFVSKNELETQLGAADLARTGTASIDVLTPGPGGGLSSPRAFAIGAAAAARPAGDVTMRPTTQPAAPR